MDELLLRCQPLHIIDPENGPLLVEYWPDHKRYYNCCKLQSNCSHICDWHADGLPSVGSNSTKLDCIHIAVTKRLEPKTRVLVACRYQLDVELEAAILVLRKVIIPRIAESKLGESGAYMVYFQNRGTGYFVNYSGKIY